MFMYASRAARRLKVDRLTLLRWEKKGKIPAAPRDRNGWRLYTREFLDELHRLLHPEEFQRKENQVQAVKKSR